MITVGEIKKALAKLDGRTFPSREDLDNAIFPLFGPLIPHFQGMSFRDLADMLIEKGWAKKDKSLGGTILVQFPPEKTETPETPETIHFTGTTPKTGFDSPESTKTEKLTEELNVSFDGNDCIIEAPTTSLELTCYNGMFQIRISMATLHTLISLLK